MDIIGGCGIRSYYSCDERYVTSAHVLTHFTTKLSEVTPRQQFVTHLEKSIQSSSPSSTQSCPPRSHHTHTHTPAGESGCGGNLLPHDPILAPPHILTAQHVHEHHTASRERSFSPDEGKNTYKTQPLVSAVSDGGSSTNVSWSSGDGNAQARLGTVHRLTNKPA